MNKLKEIKCPERFRKQCLNTVNSYGCKLRYFNNKCMFAIHKFKEVIENDSKKNS